MVVGTATARLTLAVLAISAGGTVGGTGTTTDCCKAKDDDKCCPQPPILDGAEDYGKGGSTQRVVLAPERCCPDGTDVVGCSAYGATGCSFCRDVCDKADTSCVLCSVATATSPQTPAPSNTYVAVDEWSPSPNDLETTDGLWGGFNDGSEEWDWNSEDISAMLWGGSYEFSMPWGPGGGGAEEYDCSSCAWGDMSALKQRKLTERSRSMVCDSTCLDDAGHDEYGVTLCNYFNNGKECRACCHVSVVCGVCLILIMFFVLDRVESCEGIFFWLSDRSS